MGAPVKATFKRYLVHLNNNQLCAIDTETSGTRPNYHEVVQFAILPLDANLEPIKHLPPFDILIRPEYPNRAEPDAIRRMGLDRWALAVKTGLPQEAALELFENWYNRLELGENKRIAPLAQNWPFDSAFLKELLGFETYNRYFDGLFRDTMSTASYLNDRADFDAEQIPFPKMSLSQLASKLGIEVDGTLHDAIYDCLLTSKVYKAMLMEPFV